MPENMLRSGETVFLDDMTVNELENALQVPIIIVKSSGQALFDAALGIEVTKSETRFRPYEPADE